MTAARNRLADDGRHRRFRPTAEERAIAERPRERAKGFGPWQEEWLSEEERARQFRLLAGITASLCGRDSPIIVCLCRAEDGDEAAKAEALKLFDAIPARTRREVLMVYAAVMEAEFCDWARKLWAMMHPEENEW
jgi:hypothetical protein